MSTTPPQPPPYGQPPPQQQPPPMYPPPPQQKKSNLKVILLIVGIGGFLICGGIIGVIFLGLNMVESDIAKQLENHPILVEHVGIVDEIKMDMAASIEYDDSDIWIYNVVGTKASGRLKVRSISTFESEMEEIDWALLTLADGTNITIMGSPPYDQ